MNEALEQEILRKARRRVAARLALYVHLMAYVAINILLIIINVVVSWGNFWCKWPVLGWGIVLALHALVVWLLPKGSVLRDRMIQEEMRRQAANNPSRATNDRPSAPGQA